MQRRVIKFSGNTNIWVDVETGYIINNYFKGRGKTEYQRVYAPKFDGHKACITNNGESYKMHRVLAFATGFHGNWDRFYRFDVHHIDGDRSNNHFSNLVVLTPEIHRDHHHIGASIKGEIMRSKIARKMVIASAVWEDVEDSLCEIMDR